MPRKDSTSEVACSFKSQCGNCALCARRRYKALRRIEPSDIPCKVPGCEDGRVTHDCCYRHSLGLAERGDHSLANDGIIDWLAIDVATRGLRQVRLTWVETDIAVAVLIAKGRGPYEAQTFLGLGRVGLSRSRRVVAARKIEAAGVLGILDHELRCLGAR